jgi:O-antigen ligase
MVATSLRVVARKPTVVYLLVAATVGLSAFVLFSGSATGLLTTMGRNPDLTGRTEVWKIVLRVTANPLFGAGYESFWLGDRLITLQSLVGETINQCHNGYLEVYVNLGWMGIALLAVVIVTGCQRVTLAVRRDPAAGKLRLACFVAALIYNFTEAGFKMMSLMWIIFLLTTTAVPEASVSNAANNGPTLGENDSGIWGPGCPEHFQAIRL